MGTNGKNMFVRDVERNGAMNTKCQCECHENDEAFNCIGVHCGNCKAVTNTKWEEEWRKIYDEWNNSPNAVGTIGTLAEAFIKDRITKAQQEIIDEIPNDKYLADITTGDDPIPTNEFKEQLRKKYINEK